MSWINKDSYLLIKTDAGKSFAQKNSLHTAGDSLGAYFFNPHILIHIYEERTFLQADFFDLKHERWARELQEEAVLKNIPSLREIRQLYLSFSDNDNDDDVLNDKAMDRFSLILHLIDTYMQDFLSGDFARYARLLTPLEGAHRQQMKALANKLLSHRESAQQ
jgi:hypothetical protein